MEKYVCFRCGCETGSLKGSEMFCTKCKRKMFNIKTLKSSVEESIIEGILMSIDEQCKEVIWKK